MKWRVCQQKHTLDCLFLFLRKTTSSQESIFSINLLTSSYRIYPWRVFNNYQFFQWKRAAGKWIGHIFVAWGRARPNDISTPVGGLLCFSFRFEGQFRWSDRRIRDNSVKHHWISVLTNFLRVDMEKRRKRKAKTKENRQKLKIRQSKLLLQSRQFTKLRHFNLKTRRRLEPVPPKNSRQPQQTRQLQCHLLSPPHRVFQMNLPKSAACHQEKSRRLKTFLQNESIQLSSSFNKVNFTPIKILLKIYSSHHKYAERKHPDDSLDC